MYDTAPDRQVPATGRTGPAPGAAGAWHGVVVLIPAHNEEFSVGAVVRSVQALTGVRVVVIDDGSTDATAAVAQAAGARVLPLPLPLGAWGAMQTGLRYALAQDCPTVVTMDADGQHEAQFLQALLAPLRSGQADVAIGAHVERASRARRLAWRWFRLLTGIGVRDVTSGFRAYNHRAIEVLAGPEASLLDFQDIGVLLILKRRGLRVVEVPVTMLPRRDGKSRIFSSWLVVAKYMLQTSILCLARIGQRRRMHRVLPFD